MNAHSTQQCHKELLALLGRQTDELEAINAYLGDLKSAIAEGETEVLNELLTQQRLPIAEMEDLESQRHKLLEIYGYQPDREGLLGCIAWCDSDEIISRQYELFRQALLRLQRAIQVNSLLVSKGKERVRQSLQLLVGQTNNEQATTYASNGKTDGDHQLRTIARV